MSPALRLLALTGFLLLGVQAPMPSASAQEASAPEASAFRSGGTTVGVERFDAAGGGRRPAVILLHGADGPSARYRVAARQVAAGGYHVFLVRYLERTGQARASFGSIGTNLPAWIDAAQDAVSYVAAAPGVDGRRIGVLGISLGGGIGLALGAREPRIRALVDYFGFVPRGLEGAGRLPPTLVLHGEEDRIVPVSNARTVQALLTAQGVPHEVQIYPGQGHGFTGAALADANRRIIAFFGRTLGGRAASR